MSPQQFAAWRALRKAALGRWREKKLDQRLNPKVRYRSRKRIADNRPRVKGRFIKTEALVTAN
jgi:pseudo-response regulator 9